jgi:LTXXQ motif family protein
MSFVKKRVVSAAACIVLCLAPVGPSVANTAADRLQLAMMDDDKMSMKSDASNSNSPVSAGQSGGQNMSGGRMNDDKMKMRPQGQMQDCQGAGCQEGSSGMMQMMQMMEKMMRGQMNSSSGSAAVSGPADVTERLEGRIAFLKAELQISDKQLADWSNLADALRASRQHLLEARKMLVMDDRGTGGERLERYERHLSERLEAVKSARSAFTRLYASLSDTQKQTADAILLPLLATF